MMIFNGKKIALFVFISLLAIVLPPFSTQAADCAACAAQKGDLAKKTDERDRMANVKALNENYLKDHPDASDSSQVKVKSNVLLATVKLETLQNEVVFLTDKITKECGDCPQ